MYLNGFFLQLASSVRCIWLNEAFWTKFLLNWNWAAGGPIRFKRKIVGNCFTGKSVPSLIKSDQVTEKSSAREEKCCKYRSCSREIICKNVHYNTICLLLFLLLCGKNEENFDEKNTIFDDAPITGNRCTWLHC